MRATPSTPFPLLVGGAALLMVGNAIHPIDAEPSATSRFELATGPSWPLLHLVIAAGVVVASAGLLAVLRPGTESRWSARSMVGGVAIAAGGAALAVVFAALDGYAVAAMAAEWQQASDVGREAMRPAAVVLEAIDSGLAGFGTILFFGVGLLAVAATLRDRGDVKPVAWVVAAALGAAGLVTGGVLLVDGPSPVAINVLLRPVAGATTLYLLGLGLLLRRRPRVTAGRPAPAPVPQ